MNKDTEKIFKSTQEQSVASWIERLNSIRRSDAIDNINIDEEHLAEAIGELDKLKDFIADPSHILGSIKSKHGEIAENIQVYFSDARKMFDGTKASHTLDGVGRTAPEDYLRNGRPVQMKFCKTASETLTHVKDHISKYKYFLSVGGSYVIPKDQYAQIKKTIELQKKAPDKVTGEGKKIIEDLEDLENVSGIKFGRDIHPAVVDYSDVQLANASETVDREEQRLKEKTEEKEQKACENARPTVKEGAETVFVGAAAEGSFAFIAGIARKIKEGKKLSKFTEEDWAELGIDTGKASVEGGIRGGAIYILTNFTATRANIANAYVSAAFGVTDQARAYESGEIDEEDFIVNSETLCLDAAVSAVSSLMGDILIPVPVLGAVIGNMVGMTLFSICKNHCEQKEQAAAEDCVNELEELNRELDDKFYAYVEMLYEELRIFSELESRAFDEDVNIADSGSIELARYLGVDEDQLPITPEEIYNYFH